MSDTRVVSNYDAILIVGFGGPEKRDDVMPFLENVLRGRNVPRERMLEVAEHYYHFDGISPINQQTRDLIKALRQELDRRGLTHLPMYWGNRNWHPLLPDTVRLMADNGVRRGLAVVLAAYSSYSSCRQYRENVASACDVVGDNAPVFDKMRVFYNHPDFIAANVDRVRDAVVRIPLQAQDNWHLVFTAHSIPMSMAENCAYANQLGEACRLVAETLGIPNHRFHLVYQSRSGRPTDPWLEPDVCDHLKTLRSQGVDQVVVHPIGFLSDHMEILYDLDDEAQSVAAEIGLGFVRSSTVGVHPLFVSMLAELIQERLEPDLTQRALGRFGPSHDVCPVQCCMPVRRPGPTS